jgi:flagellar assembly protein FliH
MGTIIRSPVLSDERRTLPTRSGRAACVSPDGATSVQSGVAASPLAPTATPAEPETGTALATPAASSDATRMRKETALAETEMAKAELAKAFTLAESRGFESGLAKAEAAARGELKAQLARVAAICSALQAAKPGVLADAEDMVVEIVQAAVGKIVGDSILTREGIAGAVACTLRSFREDDRLVVRLHPQDALLLRQAWEAEDNSSAMAATLREDPSIGIGGCIVDSAMGSLDARLDTQLIALRDTLLAVRMQRSSDREAG